MRGSRFTEEQIIGVLKEGDAGVATAELCRRRGISSAQIFRRRLNPLPALRVQGRA